MKDGGEGSGGGNENGAGISDFGDWRPLTCRTTHAAHVLAGAAENATEAMAAICGEDGTMQPEDG